MAQADRSRIARSKPTAAARPGSNSHAPHGAPAAGNQALQHHLRAGAIQAKLVIGGGGDPAESQADRIAEAVMNGRAKGPCACGGECPACKESASILRRKPAEGGAASGGTSARADAFGSSAGRRLDAGSRTFFEPHFGDLAHVRIHDGPDAAATSAAIGARAYTVGRDIGFAPGEFQPGSSEGRRLLAHELAHVAQGGPLLRRQPKPDPAKSAAFRVVTVSDKEFEDMTGGKASDLPEKKYVSSESVLLGPTLGALLSPRPNLPVDMGSTGIIWEGAHVTDFAAVRETNPLWRFWFGEGTLETGGFRGHLARHIGARSPDPFGIGRGLKDSLYAGVTGGFEDDWMFPLRPGAQAVHTPGGTDANAEAFAALMRQAVPDLKGKEYRFSFPRDPKTEARMFDILGKRAGTPCEPGANCITLNIELHESALGGQKMVINRNGKLIDVATGLDLATNEPAPSIDPRWPDTPMRKGEASSMNEYLGQSDEFFGSQGLRKTPLSRGMWLRGAVGVIRAGGTVLLIYNAVKTADRISSAQKDELPVVIGEEGGAWAGGAIGAILGEAFGAVVVCTGAGPGAALCLAGFAIVGGALGTGAGQDFGHQVGEGVKNLTTAKVLEAGVIVFGSKEDKQLYGDFKRNDGGDDSSSIWDLFR